MAVAITTKTFEASPLRILLIEDEAIIGIQLAQMIRGMGHETVQAGNLPDAMRAAEGEWIDFAIVDINLDGEESYPVVDLLTARNIPILFATGYDRPSMPERYRSMPNLQKPFLAGELRARIDRVRVAD